MLFRGGHQLPVVGVHPIGNRRHLLCLEAACKRVSELPAGRVGQQRVGRWGNRQPRRGRLRELAADDARIAEERLGQVTAGCEQQQEQQAEARHHGYRGSSEMMEIWCPIGPPPPRVRRR